MKYANLNYSVARRVIANVDKTSANNQSKRIHSPWGVIRHYVTRTLANGKRQRLFAVSESSVMHNGGGYTFRAIADRVTAAERV